MAFSSQESPVLLRPFPNSPACPKFLKPFHSVSDPLMRRSADSGSPEGLNPPGTPPADPSPALGAARQQASAPQTTLQAFGSGGHIANKAHMQIDHNASY